MTIRVLAGFLFPALLLAQGPQNVLLVVNANSGVSKDVGDYYRQRRQIPSGQLCTIRTAEKEEIDRTTFDQQIRAPLLACISRGLQDRILYIVLTKGVPLKVAGSGGPNGDQASVDSELTLLYADLLGLNHPTPGKVPNPYFARNSGSGAFQRFSHREMGIYLVTRLDGFDLADIRALINRGLAPQRQGRFILDLKADNQDEGNNWLRQAAERLRAAGIPQSRILLETTIRFLTGEKDVLGYASWGSNDDADHSRFLGNTWVKGALLAEYVSTDARTFERPPPKWNIGKWSDSSKTFFHDSPQSLIADYIHEGVTGAAGYVYEPYLDACVRPQILFPAYVSGLNLAESYYAAMPYLSWQTVVAGDPLVEPFPRAPLPAREADPPADPRTGLPSFFAQKLVMARASLTGEKPQVIALLIAAERRRQQGDRSGARQAVRQALGINSSSLSALLLEASLEERPEKAIALYRRIVELQPGNALALNNLAYYLATTAGRPEEALSYAARAADIAQGRSPDVLDTYGWVLYLLGKYEQACPHLERAAAAQSANAVVLFHLGMCLEKSGHTQEGRAYLERALTLGPDQATATEIKKALQRKQGS